MSLPPEIKAAIAKRSRTKGSNYERTVAKKIATYFGWKWDDCFIRTSLSSYAQPHGDLRPINEMKNLWDGAKLGPLECKNRAVWSFDQLFKTPEKSELYRYWKKSNEDCNCTNTTLVFTKNGVSDYIMVPEGVLPFGKGTAFLSFHVEDVYFYIVTLKEFLNEMWPR